MEEHAIVYKQSYSQFKSELDYELNKAAQGFVRIGYLLKQARDTDVLKDSPYQNVVEFAEAEYNLDKTTVSRFMSIHDRFGDPNDPEQLQEKYRAFGIKKLAMMLTLPDKLNEVLTDDFSAAEIKTIKDEVDEEKKITPIEVMTEDAPKAQEDLSILAKVLYQIGEAEPEKMAELMELDYLTVNASNKMLIDTLAPAGQKMYMARVPAVGKFALNVNGEKISLINLRDNKKEEYEIAVISEALGELYDMAWGKVAGPETAKGMWESIWMKEFPKVKEAPVAPVQQKKESKVSTPQKPEKAKTEHKKAENDKKLQKTDESEPIEPKLDADELMPEPVEEKEKSTVTDLSKIPARESKGEDSTVRGWKAGLSHDIGACERMLRDKQYRALRTKLEQMLQIVRRIIDYTEGEQ